MEEFKEVTREEINERVDSLVKDRDYPSYMRKPSLVTLYSGYIPISQTPNERIMDIAHKVAKTHNKPYLFDAVYGFVSKHSAFSFSSPIWSNFGLERGLPISCFNTYIPDTIEGIYDRQTENAIMTQNGGGTSSYWGDCREAGAPVTGGGVSTGSVSFMEGYEEKIKKVSQGGVRRGMHVVYTDIEHGDFDSFMKIRDPQAPIQKMTHAVCVSDEYIKKIYDGDEEANRRWAKVLEKRNDHGVPYLFYTGNANKHPARSECYGEGTDYKILGSNLCVSGDTKILTENGYIEIGSINNKKVSVWNGREFSETIVRKTAENAELLEIEFSNGSKIKATPQHKWYIKNNYNKPSSQVITHELNIGDKIEKFNLPVIEGYVDMEHPYTSGAFTADGTVSGKSKVLALYSYKKDLIKYLSIKSTSNIVCKKQDKLNTVLEDSVSHKFFVPDTSYTIESRIKWLEGYLDFDGCVVRNGEAQSIQVASTEIEFLNEVMLMIQTLGVQSKCVFAAPDRETILPDGMGGKKAYNCKKANRLLITEDGIQKLIGLGFNPKRLSIVKRTPNREASQFIKVVSINKVDNEDTYCVNEPRRHKIVLNGVISGNCNEIMLPSSLDESFVCCLLSMNLFTFDEWKDIKINGYGAVETATYVLDAVMTEFIEKAKKLGRPMERSVKFAERHRALGIGIFGWHDYLQKKLLPFTGIMANSVTRQMFSKIRKESYKASEDMANEYGACEVCKEYGVNRRHTTTMAMAPTTTNALIAGGLSQGIEPHASNSYIKTVAKGKFEFKNKALETLLESKGKNTFEIWEEIRLQNGSVAFLDFLTDDEKDVFKTFSEINQFELIEQAAIRQQYIDQGQSLNIFVPPSTPANVRSKLHLMAWEYGIKGLYYQRSFSEAQKMMIKSSSKTGRDGFEHINWEDSMNDECTSCEG